MRGTDTGQSITNLKGVGEKRAALYKKINIETIEDLLRYYPRDYVDYNAIVSIGEAEINETAVIRARVVKKLKPYIGRVSVFKIIISDGTEEMLCIFYNSIFTFEKLILDREYIFYGRVGGNLLQKELQSPIFIDAASENKLTPKYHLTAGLSEGIIKANLKNALDALDNSDDLPQAIKDRFELKGNKEALSGIHFPTDMQEFKAAKRRLAFEELLTLQLGLKLMKQGKRRKTGAKMKKCDISDFYKALPFTPTGAQLKAVDESINDMCRSEPMNRLLQGDVGSGKTLVAAALCRFAALSGFQSTLMAPTEILAEQHYGTLGGFLKPLGITVALLTGSTDRSEKIKLKKAIKSGEIDVVVGTQALIQSTVEFASLGLVITDEQHRFGVNQRTALASKGDNPHTLVMSATPIPRTLALVIYSDLDISVLDEMPKGRLPIKTYGVNSGYRERLYNFIKKYVAEGYQAYIVCPMIEENAADKSGAVEYFERLREGAFKGTPIGLLHGKMKQTDKDATMLSFKKNEIKVLVSTTVIEVGVDVPNAVIMMIENAEQFGLSQLHQLRGRVGRGSVQSHCVLVTDNNSEYTRARIDTMVRTSDGFEIANEDLRLRGPGDFFGSKQHGLPELKIADMTEDVSLLNETRMLADEIIKDDPKLKKAENDGLRRLVKKLFAGGDKYGYN